MPSDRPLPLPHLKFESVIGERGLAMTVHDAAEVGFAEFITHHPARLGVADMQRLVDWGNQWLARAVAEARHRAAKAPFPCSPSPVPPPGPEDFPRGD